MIRFITSGISTTIQDLGRFGYRKFGVPVSGAMDQIASQQANELLENDPNCAVLEFVVKGPILHFEQDCWIALFGANISARIDGEELPTLEPIFIPAGKELHLGNITNGQYAYMAIKGGIQSEVVIGSRSQFKGITQTERMTKGMTIQHKQLPFEPKNLIFPKSASTSIVKVVQGPDFHLLSLDVQKALFEVDFSIGPNSNRMGIRLETDAKLSAPEIITSPVQPGIVQLTPSGQIIILGPDAGVTGGYARILQLTKNHPIPTTDTIHFHLEFANP